MGVGPHLGGKMLKHKIRKSRKNILSLLEAVTQEEAEKGEQGKSAKETGNSRKDKTDKGYYTETVKEKTKSKGKRRAPEDAKEKGKWRESRKGQRPNSRSRDTVYRASASDGGPALQTQHSLGRLRGHHGRGGQPAAAAGGADQPDEGAVEGKPERRRGTELGS